MNNYRQHTLPVDRSKGFTLVEVLIALVVMSIGMLGIAGLYVQSMQAGRTSNFHHHAVTIAGDVADRIRANPRAGAAYAGAGANNNCVAGGVNCTPDQLAANDILLWQQQAMVRLASSSSLGLLRLVLVVFWVNRDC